MPDILKRCVVDVVGKGKGLGAAFAICTDSLQDADLIKEGTRELTAKGEKREKELRKEPDHAAKISKYEKIVKASNGESKVEGVLSKLEALGDIEEIREWVESHEGESSYDSVINAIDKVL